MRKINKIKLTERFGLTSLPVDWGNTHYYKNKEKAKRSAIKLNKHYQQQLQHYNFLYAEVFTLSREYWLFLSPFDNQQLKQRIAAVGNSLDAAIDYQDQYYNSPVTLSRICSELNAVIDSLSVYALKRKDIPQQHKLKHLKQRLEDDYNRHPTADTGEDSHKRPALRKASSGI